MKKYVLTSSGKEIKFGDRLVETISVFEGYPIPIRTLTFSEKNVDELIKMGAIKEEIIPEKEDSYYSFIIELVANRMKWAKNNVDKYLTNLYKISPIAFYTLALKELAVYFDCKYKGHISKCDLVYYIDAGSNVLSTPINKGLLDNGLLNLEIPLFRTRDEAFTALAIIRLLKNEQESKERH